MNSDTRNNLKHPLEMLVRVLLSGRTVTEPEGYEYGMDEDGHILIKGQRFYHGSVPAIDPEVVWMRVPCDVSELKRIADRIGRDALWIKGCEVVLQQEKSRVLRDKNQCLRNQSATAQVEQSPMPRLRRTTALRALNE